MARSRLNSRSHMPSRWPGTARPTRTSLSTRRPIRTASPLRSFLPLRRTRLAADRSSGCHNPAMGWVYLSAAFAPALFLLHFIYVRDKYEREPLHRILLV